MAQVKVRYLLRKSGLLYYQRRIPDDLKPHYSGRTFLRINLQTQDIGKAARLVAQYAARDDTLWRTLRSPEGKSFTTEETRAAAEALVSSWGTSRGARPDENSEVWERGGEIRGAIRRRPL